MSIGNLKTDGGKGTNYPYQSKVLLGLDRIATQIGADNVDFEAELVIDSDTPPVVYLEVRIWDQSAGEFNPPVYYLPGSNVIQTPVLPVTYIAPAVPEAKKYAFGENCGCCFDYSSRS